MPSSLFRQEAVDAKRGSWLGRIRLAQPVRLWVLTICSALAALVVVVFLILGTYSRRTHVAGQLVPVQGMASILAPVTGVVTRMDIPEGGYVKAGQPLALVSVPRATLADGDTLTALKARLQHRADGLRANHVAQQEQFNTQTNGLRNQLQAARHELTQVEGEIATQHEQIRIAHDMLERLRELETGRYASQLQIKQQESAALAQMSQLQALQRQAASIRRNIAQIEQTLAELPSQRQASEASFKHNLAQLEQEQVEILTQGELAVIAPVDGMVAAQLYKSGQSVQAGQPLLTLVPDDGTLEAELLVPSRAIGFIDPGDTVLLRYQAYPYQKFGHQQGRVSRVSRSPVSSVAGSNAIMAESFYRINVSLDQQTVLAYGKPEPLKPGMLLDADILGERRSLIEWILEPLYSIQGTVFG